MEEKERPNKERGVMRLMLVGLVVIALLYLGYFILLNNNVLKHYATPENGVIGDTFGAINSLFSALAFLAIAASLYLQNQEFRLQREELELQRQEFKAAREEQANSQEAQRREMQLTRELHVRSNFEGRLMFLLKNLEQATEKVKGNFFLNTLALSTVTQDYFNELWEEIKEVRMAEYIGNTISSISLSHHQNLKVNQYRILEKVSGHFDPIEDFSIFVVEAVHDKRRQEYYHAYMTFEAIIDALQKEYEAWNQAGFGTPEEINRHFESYIYLFKSSLPHTAYVYFIYLLSLPEGKISYSRIREMLLKRLHRTDYLRPEHQETLLENPQAVPTK